MARGAALQLAEVGVEDAGAAAGGEAIEKSGSEDVVDFVTAVMATDTAPGRVAADEFADGLAVAELAGDGEAVVRMGAIFRMTPAGEDALGGFFGQGFDGFQGMAEIRDAPEAEGLVLADRAGDPTAPDVADTVTHR